MVLGMGGGLEALVLGASSLIVLGTSAEGVALKPLGLATILT